MKQRRRGRPAGLVSQALVMAAATPGTVRQLAQRACIGHAVARVTASRLVASGALVVVEPGQRPAVLKAAGSSAIAAPPVAAGVQLGAALRAWSRA